MESKKLVRVHISENLSTTVPYDDFFWDSRYVYIECPNGQVKTYDRSCILGFEIFEI